jgi:hypothetical protein
MEVVERGELPFYSGVARFSFGGDGRRTCLEHVRTAGRLCGVVGTLPPLSRCDCRPH